MKKILTIVGALAVLGGGIYLVLNLVSPKLDSQEALSEDYNKLFDEIDDLVGSSSKSDLCVNQEKNSNQIEKWQTELEKLQSRKKDLLESELSNGDYTDLPASEVLLPGSQPLELSDGGYTDLPVTEVLDGSEPLELSDGNFSDLSASEFVPGSQPLELSGGDYTDLPASEILNSDSESVELYEGDYTDLPATEALDGSQPLELSNGDYTDLPTGEVLKNDEDGWSQINKLEEKIEQDLNILIAVLSLCEDEKDKEVISNSCELACEKYSDCAGYADDDTPEDLVEAYESCMEECVKWSEDTVICINKKLIKSPIDCANLSQCALKEYNGLMQ